MDREHSWNELQRLIEVARRVDSVLFARSRPGLYLLGVYPSSPDSPLSQQRRRKFATAPAISVDEMMSLLRPEHDAPLAGRLLCRVAKSERNPFAGRISVGRAPNNDVAIAHPSISKLHAHFLPPEEATAPEAPPGLRRRTPLPWSRPQEADAPAPPLLLVDTGSRNGTWINGERLAPETPRPVAPEAEIRFGDVFCTLLDAQRLHDHLLALAR